jgi:hypothetical protein
MSGDPLHCRHCDQVFDSLNGHDAHMIAKHPDSRSAGERPGLIDATVAFDCYD